MIVRDHPALSLSRQCRLRAGRSSLYYSRRGRRRGDAGADSPHRRALPEVPVFARRMALHCAARVCASGGAGPQSDRLMGLQAIYRAPRTSAPHAEHRVWPYLLRGLAIERPNHVWCADITYIPVQRGFLYLVAVMDWASRFVLAWRLSNTLDASFCTDASRKPWPGMASRRCQHRPGQPVHPLPSPGACRRPASGSRWMAGADAGQ